MHIGLKAKEIEKENLPASNLVFLVDVSGSMDEPNKLPLLRSSLRLLVNQLRENDRISIVTYAIEKKRASGVFLTVLGYGMGNYKDSKMQILAQKGNGNHAYIDNLSEAKKVLVKEFGSTLFTVAKDVKLQIEFNPAKVQAYRLIGYETRLLNKEDFNDDTKDAGEMGAGHTVTALYEIIPVGVEGVVDELKYQKNIQNKQLTDSPELVTVKMRYKQLEDTVSSKIEVPVIDNQTTFEQAGNDFRFSASVAAFGMLLNNSAYAVKITAKQVKQWARQSLGQDMDDYRHQFVELVDLAVQLTDK